jgi:H+/Cl- antiporter ClcA
VLIGTIITHLFGGHGREGTAVQMAGQLINLLFSNSIIQRKTLIILGISAGFASVFGTPLAGLYLL